MPKSRKISAAAILIASCLFVIASCGIALLQAQTTQHSKTLEEAAVASRQTTSLSADILLTWRAGGLSRESHGTIQLQRPNLARIVLQGDYPEVLLVSDGHTRYFAPSDTQYQPSSMDAGGLGIDSPWWGLPFRYFFTQSANPFGATPDRAAVFQDVPNASEEQAGLHSVSAQGISPMGGYTEKLSFDSNGDLVKSSVQFGEGPNAAIFNAVVTNIRHDQIAGQTFRFSPAPGQFETANTDAMLPLGGQAPSFALPTASGQVVSLADQRRSKKAVLVNFWYYNCAPCRIEFPEFEKLYQQLDAQGLNVIAINKADSPKVVSDYVKKTGLSFTVLMGGSVSKTSVFAKYKVTKAFPGTYLLDDNGKIVYRSAGEDVEGLKKALAQLGFK